MTIEAIKKIKKALTLHELAVPVLSHLEHTEEEIQNLIASDKPFINELSQYMLEYKGKRIRPALLLLIGSEYGQIGPQHIQASAVVELIHTATLVHDDVMDGAEIRRHKETVNKKWSNHTAVMLGDFLYTRAFNELSNLPDPRPFQMLTQITSYMCEGEIMQLYNRFNLNLKREAYDEIIRHKTACLFAASAWLGAHMSGLSTEKAQLFYQFGESLGMAFQIMDDLMDLMGDEHKEGKSLGTDLKQGKMTLPLIHLMLLEGSDAYKIKELIQKESFSPYSTELRKLLVDSGAVEKTVETAVAYCTEAQRILYQLSTNFRYLKHIPDIILHEIPCVAVS